MHFRESPIWSKLYSYIKSSKSVRPYVNLQTTERISDIDCGCLVYPTWICRCNRTYSRSSRPEVFCKKGALRRFAKFTGKHPCQNLFFNKVAGNFIKNETLAQLFSCELCKIFKNIEHLWWLLLVFIFHHVFLFVFPVC